MKTTADHLESKLASNKTIKHTVKQQTMSITAIRAAVCGITNTHMPHKIDFDLSIPQNSQM